MTVEGIITEIMETWPLQLVVMGEDQRYDVALVDSTTIRRGNTLVDAAQLHNNQRVRIVGQRYTGNAITALTLDILS